MGAEVWQGIMIPFLGTSLGAACVYVMRGRLNANVQRALTGFAAGVMMAASVWSLLLPAIDQSRGMGPLCFVPAAAGLWLGVLFLLWLDRAVPRLQGWSNRLSGTAMLVLAVTLHNLPEGMAVGAVFAGWLQGDAGITVAGAMALSLGIAIQNFPEGAIIAMPLRADGMGKGRAFLCGVLSGVIEPIGALATIAFSGLIVPLLPIMLSFAAGAMICVVIRELIPENASGAETDVGTWVFTLGFTVMMAMDTALG